MSQCHPIQNDVKMLITTVSANRRNFFAHAPYAREAIETLYRVQQFHPLYLYGFVVMPDHCHFLLYIPSLGSVSKMMSSYKSGVAFNIGVHELWQRRFHIRIVDDIHAALRYIHANPIRKGIAEVPEAYPWSSACGKWDVSALDVP